MDDSRFSASDSLNDRPVIRRRSMQWPGDFALRERTTTGQRWADEEPRSERTLEGYYNDPPFQLDAFGKFGILLQGDSV